MSSGNHFYNGMLRFYSSLFEEIFNDVYIKRNNKYVKVPIEWIDKRQAETQRNENPNHEYGKTITLPRMGFRLSNFEYASYRNKNRNNLMTGSNGQSLNRKPYDFTYELYIKTKNIGDMYEILEQIMVQFDPYLEVDVIDNDNIGIESNIAIELLSNNTESQNIGVYADEEVIESTLQFKLKGYLYHQTTKGKQIKKIILNYYNDYLDDVKVGTDIVTEEGIKHE